MFRRQYKQHDHVISNYFTEREKKKKARHMISTLLFHF